MLLTLVLTAAATGSLWLPSRPGPAPVPVPVPEPTLVIAPPPPVVDLAVPEPPPDRAAVGQADVPGPSELPILDPPRPDPPPEPALVPAWVQAHRATLLWSGPDADAIVFTDLPQWTFLRPQGPAQAGRLLVEYAGDFATRQPGLGWVDADAVGPAGDPGRWVANHRAATLWSGPDDAAVTFTTLAQWTRLRLVDAARSPDRLEVEFFGDDNGGQPGLGWVDRADIGPVTPPDPRTLTPGRDFIEEIAAAARRSQRSTGVPASVTIAQAILESDWGRSRLSREAHNLFGIKAQTGPGPAGVISLATWEHLGGLDRLVQASFRAYNSLEESVADHGAFFLQNERYTEALAVSNDPRAFARAINQAGYATDPGYAAKLIRLMDRYDLYRFDRPA